MKTRVVHAPLALALALALAASACAGSSSGGGGAGGSGTPTTPPSQQMQAVVASVDLYAGAPQRFLVGLPFGDGTLLSYGSVSMRFAYTGTAERSMSPEAGPEAAATYIPTPGTPDGGSSPPTVTQPAEARGVYQAEGVTFDRAGIWTVDVTADVGDAGMQTARATFQVGEQPALPAPGQPALPTENLTIDSKGVPPGAIDSRADVGGGTIPDAGLHEWTIAKALAEHRPVLVIFGTPVYCVSRFCGPNVDLVEELSKRYADRAVFIHIEIWRDFQKQQLNQAAADWLYRGGDLTEPWLYLIDADGTIADRWGPLFSEQEVSSAIARLPPMKGSG